MNKTISDIVRNLQQDLSKIETTFREQQKELEITRFERDVYKELFIKSQNMSNNNTSSNVVFIVIYSMDNGEGVDTQRCIGVFTTKTQALKAVLDVCKSNGELDVNGFTIEELSVDKKLETGNSVYVVQCDEEAHCEISTTILDVKCNNHINEYNDCYSVEYTVDNVYYIE